MEILCDGDKVAITVNGHKTLEGVKASPRIGKILIQSEGAEIFFRRLDVYPLKQTVDWPLSSPHLGGLFVRKLASGSLWFMLGWVGLLRRS